MLEAYEAYGSWETMADMVEGMICHIAEKLFGGLKIVHHRGTENAEEKTINSNGRGGECRWWTWCRKNESGVEV